MAATATPETKTRDVIYFAMKGTKDGAQIALTPQSIKPLEKARDVLAIHAKASDSFPMAFELRAALDAYLKNPRMVRPEQE